MAVAWEIRSELIFPSGPGVIAEPTMAGTNEPSESSVDLSTFGAAGADRGSEPTCDEVLGAAGVVGAGVAAPGGVPFELTHGVVCGVQCRGFQRRGASWATGQEVLCAKRG